MPRSTNAVNKFRKNITSRGAIETHFHGAFGTDFFRLSPGSLYSLSVKNYKAGIEGYVPTLLSTPKGELECALSELGTQILEVWEKAATLPKNQRLFALPLGIHLEGPFLNPKSAGAHPSATLISPNLKDLKNYWEMSKGTLSIITLAPEMAEPKEIREILKWTKKNEIRVQLGHTHCSSSQAKLAFRGGAQGITHLWNAMRVHHRDLGVLGAASTEDETPAFGVEIIPDGLHVSFETLAMSHKLLGEKLYWVSDATPLAGLKGHAVKGTMGPLNLVLEEGVAYIDSSHVLAGNGQLLPALAPKALQALNQLGISPALQTWIHTKPLNILPFRFQEIFRKFGPKSIKLSVNRRA